MHPAEHVSSGEEMGDTRFDPAYRRVVDAEDKPHAIDSMSDEELVAALGGASRSTDPLLANVLATAAINRVVRARAVFRHMGEGAYVVDADGLIVELNPRAEQLLGWTTAQARRRSPHDLFHGGPAETCPVLNVLRTGREVMLEEETYVSRAGRSFPVSVIAAPILREGTAEGLVAVFRDISERKEIERRLRESEFRWRQLADASEEGVVVHDDGIILAYNPAAARMFMTGETDMRGRSVVEFVALSSQRGVVEAIQSGTPGPYRAEALRTDGTVFPVEATARTITWRDKAARVVVFRDLSAIVEAEASRRFHHEQLRALFEGWEGPAFCLDEKGRFLELNEVVARMLGRPREQCLGRPFLPILPADQVDVATQLLREALAGDLRVLDTQLCEFDGRIRAVRFRVIPVYVEDRVVAVHALGEWA